MKLAYTTVSPQSWGLAPAMDRDSPWLDAMGLPARELEARARLNTRQWLVKQFNGEAGAFHGYYDPGRRELAAPQTVNLIAPFQLLAAFDRYQDQQFLDMARRCSNWLNEWMVENHPMSLVLGGVRDNIKPTQLWTKYTADNVVLNLVLHERSGEQVFLDRAVLGSRFLLQSRNHGFAPKYDHFHESWIRKGWQSFGRAIAADLALEGATNDESWLDGALLWAEYGLSLQAADGCFYLINDDYYSSDIAADELRAFIWLAGRTPRTRFLNAGLRFANWHLAHQTPSGAWPLSIDRWGVTVGPYVGPGDIPNIAAALMLVHKVTNDFRYLVSAVKALRYSVSQQYIPGQPSPYADDPNTHWGFWSWDPRYDFTMSADQSTHHTRGYWFFVDYFLSLPEQTLKAVAEAVGPPDPSLPRLEAQFLAPP